MWPQNVPSDRSLLGNQEDILFVCFWVVSGCVARVDSHQEGLHQSGGGLQAGHHLHRGPEASPHSPLLLGQSWEGADAFTPLSCRVPFDFCCAAVTVLITSCRLGRVAMSQRAPRWTAPSHTRPSSTSTCAAMLGFRWRIHESALFIDERVVPSFLLSVQFLKSYELFSNWMNLPHLDQTKLHNYVQASLFITWRNCLKGRAISVCGRHRNDAKWQEGWLECFHTNQLVWLLICNKIMGSPQSFHYKTFVPYDF